MCLGFCCTRFIKAASLQGLSQQDTTTASLCKAISEDTQSDLIIDCSSSPPTLSNTGKSHTCRKERYLVLYFLKIVSPQSVIVFVMTGSKRF